MILIVSNRNDFDTNTVTKWLNHYEQPFIRVNSEEEILLQEINFQTGDIWTVHRGKRINLKEVQSVWYRRGKNLKLINVTDQYQLQTEGLDPILAKTIAVNLKEEYATLNQYIQYELEKKQCLTEFDGGNVNKLILLDQARAVGLAVPESWVATRKSQVHDWSPQLNLITKACCSGIYQHTATQGFYTYTESVDDTCLGPGNEPFYPSLVQEKVAKKLELRIFFLEDEYYPMAIFSQYHQKSAVDNRKGSEHVRKVPYQLPKEIQARLQRLMEKLNIKTGSIDMLVTETNDYIFLEVNPVGQIGMTSYPCNYPLHQKIAQWLIPKKSTLQN